MADTFKADGELIASESFSAGSAIAVGDSGTAKLRYNEATGFLQVSINGGAYANLTTGSDGLPSQSGNSGKFITTNGTTASWATLTQDLIEAAFTATIASGPTTPVEIGTVVTNPALTFTYNRTAVAATINDGTGAVAVSSPYSSYTYSGTYTKTVPNQSYTFTLTANESGGPSKTGTRSLTFQAKGYYGLAVPSTINASFIGALGSSTLKSAVAGSFSVSAGNGAQKWYYAFPSSFGAITSVTSGGFSVPVALAGSNISFTNLLSATNDYNVWATEAFPTLAGTFVVT